MSAIPQNLILKRFDAHTDAFQKTVTYVNAVAVQYSPTILKTEKLTSLEETKLTPSDESVLWLDVSDFDKLEDLFPLEKRFSLHRLALEDCVHVRQRPKVDEYDDFLFFISRAVVEANGKYGEGPQLGIFFGKNFVITIHKEKMERLNKILDDIKEGKPQLLQSTASFLLYTLMDTIVDDLEEAVKKVEEMEGLVGGEVLGEKKSKNLLKLIYSNRSNLLLVRRLLRPQSDVICRIARDEFQIINKGAELFIRDVYDHTLRTLDRIDSLLDINLGSLNIYGSAVSERMNETIRILTVISTIGVPLTVLVGWYGMNFREMPEIYSPYGYLLVGLMALFIVIGTILLFKRKRWL